MCLSGACTACTDNGMNGRPWPICWLACSSGAGILPGQVSTGGVVGVSGCRAVAGRI